jgi:hypothetical protein
MKHSERFALDHFLSDYPRGLSFDDVIDRILDDDQDEVCAWQVVENYGPHGIVEMINDLRHHFECVVDGMKRGIELSQLTEEESKTEHEERTA